MKELLNIANRHASGEEAVEAAFIQGEVKAAHGSGQGVSLKAVGKGAKRGTKGDKRGPKQ
jgi:hypothetical protein